MEKKQFDFVYLGGKYSVVNVPGRKFPAITIQGDSLREMLEYVLSAIEAVPKENKAAHDELGELKAHLTEMISFYERFRKHS